jgi:hypothetical protein
MDIAETHPRYNSTGTLLAYSADANGLDQIFVHAVSDSNSRTIGHGSEPLWALENNVILGVLNTPSVSQGVMYSMSGIQPQIASNLIGHFKGLAWTAYVPETELFQRLSTTSSPDVGLDSSRTASERLNLVEVPEISPAGSLLSPLALEPFQALRQRTVELAGWDFLSQLESAWIGLNDPLPPGYAFNDWLYTGRAFAFHPAALQSGWVEIEREDHGAETYWRVYLRTKAQDGSRGHPIAVQPWNLSARYNGNSTLYNEGGSLKAEPPDGYYLDFTALAADYGFQRVSALPTWRTYYKGARYNEFALTLDQSWETAMLEIYPKSAIATPTIFQTPSQTPTTTPTPTRTPWWLRWRTATPTFSPTETASTTSTP